ARQIEPALRGYPLDMLEARDELLARAAERLLGAAIEEARRVGKREHQVAKLFGRRGAIAALERGLGFVQLLAHLGEHGANVAPVHPEAAGMLAEFLRPDQRRQAAVAFGQTCQALPLERPGHGQDEGQSRMIGLSTLSVRNLEKSVRPSEVISWPQSYSRNVTGTLRLRSAFTDSRARAISIRSSARPCWTSAGSCSSASFTATRSAIWAGNQLEIATIAAKRSGFRSARL